MNNVAVGIVIRNGKVLMVRLRRPEGCLHWQFPGGSVEENESAAIAAERETLEETGVNCSANQSLGQRVHPDTGKKIYYFICEYLNGRARVRDTEGVDRVKWMTPKEVFQSITSDIYPPVREFIDQQI